MRAFVVSGTASIDQVKMMIRMMISSKVPMPMYMD
ncbi:MAG: hypothetical protein QOD55_2429, partial [Solirubrobacteraceae bacterium]|nr:hypothetical protein [Solirubrobacteraceae bacterium]